MKYTFLNKKCTPQAFSILCLFMLLGVNKIHQVNVAYLHLDLGKKKSPAVI